MQWGTLIQIFLNFKINDKYLVYEDEIDPFCEFRAQPRVCGCNVKM